MAMSSFEHPAKYVESKPTLSMQAYTHTGCSLQADTPAGLPMARSWTLCNTVKHIAMPARQVHHMT